MDEKAINEAFKPYIKESKHDFQVSSIQSEGHFCYYLILGQWSKNKSVEWSCDSWQMVG